MTLSDITYTPIVKVYIAPADLLMPKFKPFIYTSFDYEPKPNDIAEKIFGALDDIFEDSIPEFESMRIRKCNTTHFREFISLN